MANTSSTLATSCTLAQMQFPKNCNGAVKLIAKRMGYTLPDIVANGLVDYFNENWTVVTAEQAQKYADTNWLVVAGKKELGGSGHVVVVLPGGMVASGGYAYTDKKSQTIQTARNRGNFPRSCSTAAGSWPGARSNGDKSVFDAWGSAENYRGVTYWVAPLNH